MWLHYVKYVDAIVFVIDSADRERIRCLHGNCGDCMFEEMECGMKSKESKKFPILVFANKQDLVNPYPAKELEMIFDCNKLFDRHKWKIQPCSASYMEIELMKVLCG